MPVLHLRNCAELGDFCNVAAANMHMLLACSSAVLKSISTHLQLNVIK